MECDLLPEVIHHHVGVRESRSAIHGNNRKRAALCAEALVTNIDCFGVNHPGEMRNRFRMEGCGNCKQSGSIG